MHRVVINVATRSVILVDVGGEPIADPPLTSCRLEDGQAAALPQRLFLKGTSVVGAVRRSAPGPCRTAAIVKLNKVTLDCRSEVPFGTAQIRAVSSL